jgi:calcineurin-like phosphoesterase family protein
MNKVLTENWNELVAPQDEILILGDFSLGSRDKVIKKLLALNGIKTLVRGNHDKRSDTVFREGGIIAICEEIEVSNLVFSHYPKDIGKTSQRINIHGHVHNNAVRQDGKHLCVCVEKTDYKPVLLESIIEFRHGFWRFRNGN